jgi:hypothetical protein
MTTFEPDFSSENAEESHYTSTANVPKELLFVGFEVLTAVVMKSSVFCYLTPCSRLTSNTLHGIYPQKIELFTLVYFLFSKNRHTERFSCEDE